MDPDDAAFEATLAEQRGRRRERFERTVARLRELDLADRRPPARRVALGRRRARTTDRRPGAHRGRPRDDASRTPSRRLLGWGKPGYVPRSGLGPVEAIEAIRAAGGLAVLAHFGEAPSRVEVVRELVEAGLGGLEVYYRSFDAATVFAVGEVASALDLVPTGGSDYHGDTSTYAEAHAGLWVPPRGRGGWHRRRRAAS